MASRQLPNGQVVDYPDSWDDEKFNSVMAKKYPDLILDESTEPKEDKVPESLKDMIMRYGVKGPIAGASKSIGKISNFPLKALSTFPGVGDEFGKHAKTYQEDFNIESELGLPENKNIGDMISQLGPEIIASMFIPSASLGRVGQAIGNIPKAGPYLNAIMSQALPQAGFAAAMSEDGSALEEGAIAGAYQAPFSIASEIAKSPLPSQQKLASIIGGIAAGGLTTLGLEQMGAPHGWSGLAGAGAGILGGKGIGTKAMMMDDLTKGIDMGVAMPRIEASQRLGLSHLTPAEAALSPVLSAKEGALGKTEEGGVLALEKERLRVASEEKAINKFLEDLYDPVKMKSEIDRGYAQLVDYKVPDTYYSNIKKDPIFKAAEKELMTDPVWKKVASELPHHKENVFDANGQMKIHPQTGEPVIKLVPSKDNVAYFDAVKKVIDAKMNKPENQSSGTRLAALEGTKNDLLKGLDEMHPGYKDVRYLSERQLTRESLEKVFNKKDIRSGANFYKALNDEPKFNDILHNLRNLPELQSRLKDMRELFKDFGNPEGLKGAKFKGKKGLDQQRDWTKAGITALENMFTNGKFDKDAIEFMTSPNWHEQMKDINKISDRQKRNAKALELVGNMAAQSSRSNVQQGDKNG